MGSTELQEKIDALAYKFWSIRPRELDEWIKTASPMPEKYKGGVRAWFFSCNIRDQISNCGGY